jgi:WD40 repeat protein
VLALTPAHKADIYSVVSTEDATITGSGDGHINLWDHVDPNAGPMLLDEVVKAGIHHLSTDKAGNRLAAVGFDGLIYVYDLKTRKREEFCKFLLVYLDVSPLASST